MTGWVGRRRGVMAGVMVAIVALPLALITAPLWLTVTALIDLIGRRWRLPTVRLGVFTVSYLVHEWIGMARAAQLITTGRTRERAPHSRMQAWWLGSQLTWAGRLLGFTVDWAQADTGEPIELPPGRFILVSRHASAVDAIIPAVLVNTRANRPVHYLLKAELSVDPCLGYFGRRLGNHFVRRGDDRDTELAAIAQVGANALPRSGTVIFPEGTYANDRTRARVHASLERKGETEVLELARDLNVLLPPKPAGLLTLIDQMPDADVVFLCHQGLEGFSQFRGIRRRVPMPEPIQLRTWTVAARDVPSSEEARVEWLNAWWRQIDDILSS